MTAKMFLDSLGWWWSVVSGEWCCFVLCGSSWFVLCGNIPVISKSSTTDYLGRASKLASFQLCKEHCARRHMPVANDSLPSRESLLAKAPTATVDLPGHLDDLA